MGYLTKMNKGLISVVGPVWPRAGTALAIKFYRRTGMRIVGEPTFIAYNAWFDSSQNYTLITLREGSTISRDVRILTHDWSPLRTLRSLGHQGTSPIGRLEPVDVGPHAFIGMGAILMPGATIGRGAIIGAGAVVRGVVPDYAIVIGNPGKIIGDARDYVKAKFPEEWAALPEST
jgi:acetyltransferase-like isoleucine patch superfamily enzyme